VRSHSIPQQVHYQLQKIWVSAVLFNKVVDASESWPVVHVPETEVQKNVLGRYFCNFSQGTETGSCGCAETQARLTSCFTLEQQQLRTTHSNGNC
jgi:hypothetical protein